MTPELEGLTPKRGRFLDSQEEVERDPNAELSEAVDPAPAFTGDSFFKVIIKDLCGPFRAVFRV